MNAFLLALLMTPSFAESIFDPQDSCSVAASEWQYSENAAGSSGQTWNAFYCYNEKWHLFETVKKCDALPGTVKSEPSSKFGIEGLDFFVCKNGFWHFYDTKSVDER